MKKTSSHKSPQSSPTVLLILDGWGIAPKSEANAIELAKKPVFDHLWNTYPHSTLEASGLAVGLHTNQAGNSEAGHLNIGAGRVVAQDAVAISQSIATGLFFKNQALDDAYRHIEKNKSDLHLMGLLSNGQSAHSNPEHLHALLVWARKKKIKNVYLHLFTDGRDSPPHSALKLMEALMRTLKNKEVNGKRSGEWIATVTGRFYAMDRKKAWERTEATYNAIVCGKGRAIKSPQAAITQAYNRGESDEFIQPYIMKRNGKAIANIKEGDAIIFFNLRSDRARQLAKPFVQPEFNVSNPGSFKRREVLKNIVFVALTDFGPDLDHIYTAFPSVDLKGTLPMALRGKKQVYIAEKEKYAHITYFINGGYADPVAGEDRIMVPSANVHSYDQEPAMSVKEITRRVIAALAKYDFVAINFAIPDMVAHSGNIAACIKSVEVIDTCIKKLHSDVSKRKGTLIITADHGNADKMLDVDTGEMYTEHTTNPVPFLLVSSLLKNKKLRKKGKLADVAPTILKVMGVKKPKEMTGKSLF